MEILYIILTLIFLGVVIWRPRLGGLIILATLPSYLLRFDILGIPTTVLEINIVLWFLVTFYLVRRQKKIDVWKNILQDKLFLLFIAFIVIGLVTTLVPDDMRTSLGAWKGWMLNPALFLATALYHYQDAKEKMHLLYASMITVGMVSIWGLVEYVGGFGMQIPGYINAMFTSANYVALLIIPLWFLALGLSLDRWYKQKISTAEILAWVIFHGLVLATILLTKSYAGLLALGVGGLYTLISLPKDFKFKKIIISASLVVVIVLAGFVINSDKLASFQNKSNSTDTNSYNSLETRQQIWTVSLSLIKDRPWLGFGFGNFEPTYYKRAFQLYSPPLEWEVPRAHNLFIHTWAETGIFGLAVLVILLIQILTTLKKSLSSDKNYYFIKIGIITAVLSVIIHGLLDTPYYKNDLSIVFVTLILFTILRNEKLD